MRKSVDPFGISTLDLLSNALGATILLMLIVAVKSRGNSDIPNDAPPQVGSGKFQTLDMGKEKESQDSNYIVQIKFFNRIDSIKKPHYEVFRTDDSLDVNGYWLIKVKGNDENNFSLIANHDDSVQATVFRGGAPIWHNTSKVKKGDKIIDFEPRIGKPQ